MDYVKISLKEKLSEWDQKYAATNTPMNLRTEMLILYNKIIHYCTLGVSE